MYLTVCQRFENELQTTQITSSCDNLALRGLLFTSYKPIGSLRSLCLLVWAV
jgi:hypothetical protein